MDKAAHLHDFTFGPQARDASAFSALACHMFDALAQEQAGERRSRAVSVHLDFLGNAASGALTGRAEVTKSTASALFMAAELKDGTETVLRATALYGLVGRGA